MSTTKVIAPQTGAAFELNKGDILTVIDPMGQQVSDMVLFSSGDQRKRFQQGKPWILRKAFC